MIKTRFYIDCVNQELCKTVEMPYRTMKEDLFILCTPEGGQYEMKAIGTSYFEFSKEEWNVSLELTDSYANTQEESRMTIADFLADGWVYLADER